MNRVFRSRYNSRYEKLNLGFLTFVVATIVAMTFFRRICSSRPGDGEQRGQSLAALTACDWGLYCFQPQLIAACLTCRLDVVCPSRLGGMMQPARAAHGAFFSLAGSSLPPGLRARRARFPTCGVVRVAGYSVVWDCDPTPIFLLKSTKRSAAAIIRPQRSFITFHGALRNILLSAGFSAMLYMIVLEQMFVNNLSQKIFLSDAASESNRFYQ